MSHLSPAAGVLVLATCLFASDLPPDSGVPVSVVVTIRGEKNAPPPAVKQDDILVSQNKQHRQVTGLEPIQGPHGIQLWLLVDDGAVKSLATQFGDLRQFILAQPASTQIGIGYLHNGMVEKVQPLTADHELSAKAMRLPTGPPGISAAPYSAVEDLIHKWPDAGAAREILLVSSGVDPEYGLGPDDPYLDAAIHEAQRAGVVVYSIFYSAAGAGRSGSPAYWGQYNLSQICDATGGVMYWMGALPPPSITPYLDDLTQRLDGQYLLTFLAKPEKKNGLESVQIKSELPHVKVTGPSEVYVPASRL